MKDTHAEKTPAPAVPRVPHGWFVDPLGLRLLRWCTELSPVSGVAS